MRHGGAQFTSTMNAQYDTLRHLKHRELAAEVLAIVGRRRHNGKSFVAVADIEAHEADLVLLAGQLKAWYTAQERHQLYKNNVRLGLAIARMVLHTVGHPLTEVYVSELLLSIIE